MPSKRRSSKTRPSVWRGSFDKVLFLIILSLFFLAYPGQNRYTRAISEIGTPTLREVPVSIPPPAPYPENITGVFPGEEITASGVVVIDVDSAVVLYKRNEAQKLAPASTTKILTALTVLDHFSLDDVITIDAVLSEGQIMGLVRGERMTVENLLYGLLIHSGNDAAYALADAYPGGRDAFVDAMNRKAREIHMADSYFTNPAGFDDALHRVTPLDMARLARFAVTNKTIAKMVSIPQITVSDVGYTRFHQLTNVNQLLGVIPGVGGIKTGWTEEAGESLVTLAQRGDRRVIIVLLGSLDRFGETVLLMDWVFSNHAWRDYTEQLSG